jgi:hypothetical protein
MSQGNGSLTAFAGIYRGPGTPSKIVLGIGGGALQARVYTLPGSPGWIAYYTEASTSFDFRGDKATVRAYAADGTLLLAARL